MSLRSRILRTSILIIVVGAIATASLFSVVRNDVDKLDRERVDRPAAEALLGVQQLTAAVDQILATGKGVVATSGLDPSRFAAVLAHDVNQSPTDTLAGMALVTRAGGSPRVVARVGNTHLLTNQLLTGGRGSALEPGSSSTLVAFRHDRQTFDLGFGARVPLRDPRTGQLVAGGAAVYLEVSMPDTAPSSGYITPARHVRAFCV